MIHRTTGIKPRWVAIIFCLTLLRFFGIKEFLIASNLYFILELFKIMK
ncbi:hypothetical protein ADIS_2010 [Lunatimonas lonarensis]|uniref:Uncharacterized protein n=1 Tax=Lunatimonas lonarensis TaxID=1232681 RepID=R7ZTM9_9BACT|nr:hypothetical protein ADIS_2010 [Lunatimonas lonarensis]